MSVEIREGWVPGAVGEIAAAHGRYYAEHWDFGPVFESKVAGGLAAFAGRMGADDLMLTAWKGADFAGSLVIDANDPAAGGLDQLHWFFVAAPGRGLGARLMERAMAHVDARGRACVLETFAGLDAARRLYERHGFVLTDETEARTWGTPVREQRFERPARL